MDIRLRQLGLAAWPNGADDVAFGDRGAARRSDRPQVDECDGVAGRRLNGHDAAADRDRPREADRSARRRSHVRARRGADVDPSVLSGGVRVVAEREWLKHRPVHGPGPGECGRRADLERQEDRKQDDETLHRLLLLVVCYGNKMSVAR
jgi:hypothetical protein